MKTLYSIVLGTINDGTVNANIRKKSVTNTTFSLWFHGDNDYCCSTYWMALGKS